MVVVHIVLGKANPSRMNGVNKVVYQLASNQAIAGKKVKLWGITKDQTHNYGERVFETVLFPKAKLPFSISPQLKQAIIDEPDAVFHLHGGWIPEYYAIAKVIKKHSKKCILTPHGAYNGVAMKKSAIQKKIYFQLFEKRLLNTVEKIHCLGQSEKDGLNEIYKNEKQMLLPYGFENNKNSLNPRTKRKFIVGFIGRIDIHTKGLDILLDAFEKFSNHLDTELWVVGDSDELPQLKNDAKALKCSNKINFFGSKFGDEKNELLSQMSVFVHASRNEGLPTAVLEAASFGVPSIVSFETNVGHYITKHNAGICLSQNNAQELSNALTGLHTAWLENSIEKLSTNADQMLEEEFSWPKLVYKYDHLYA